MKEEQEQELIINKTDKNSLKPIELNEPIYRMTIESEKGTKEVINIYPNSKPEEIAYNFCKDNNLDFQTLELMINQIKKLMKSIETENKENIKKVAYLNEPILEDSEEQQSISTEKIKKTKSFKDNLIKSIEMEVEQELEKGKMNNNNNDTNDIDKYKLNYIKIDENLKDREFKNHKKKTSSIITNTINNCLDLVEKEEKYCVSNNDTFSSKAGSSSLTSKHYSNNSKENINLFNIDKEKEKNNNKIPKRESASNSNINIDINPKIIISKSFIKNLPSNINNNYLNFNNNNNYSMRENKASIIRIQQKNNNSNKNAVQSNDNKYSNKIKSLKNSRVNSPKYSFNNNNNYSEYYNNKQKEIIKNSKNKSFQRIINMIKKNNVDINQISNENLTKNNSIKKKNMKNDKKENMKNLSYKVKLNNNIFYGINNKANNLKINNVYSNKHSSKENIYYIDTNEKDNFYSLSKNDDTSTLNNLIKNSMSSHYFSNNNISNNFSNNKNPKSENNNSIKHEINITILSSPKKLNNIQKNNNIIILGNNTKNTKGKNKNYQTLSNIDKKKYSLQQDRPIRDFKTKIVLTKNNDSSKLKQININYNYDKKKMSPINDSCNLNNIKKKYDFFNNNISLCSPSIIREFFNESNLKRYKNNFKSPNDKSNTSQTTMKNFIIKNYKTNMHKDSFINNNNKVLLNQSSRNNILNDYNQRCNSFNDFNSNINNIFINLKYSNNKKTSVEPMYLDKYNLDNNSYFKQHQNKKKITKKRNISYALSSNRINNSHSIHNKKSMNQTTDKAIINNMNLNLNITTESNNNSYSVISKKKFYNSNNSSNNNSYNNINVKNKISNKCSSKNNLNKKRPCYLFIKSQNTSSLSTSQKKKKKNHSTLIQNSSLTIGLLKKNKIANSLKNLFLYLSNKNNQIDIFKINKNKIPEDAIKLVQYIIHNCEQNQRILTIKEFIMKGTLLFDSLTTEEQISILNFRNEK